jgi:hypothetical protein
MLITAALRQIFVGWERVTRLRDVQRPEEAILTGKLEHTFI